MGMPWCRQAGGLLKEVIWGCVLCLLGWAGSVLVRYGSDN